MDKLTKKLFVDTYWLGSQLYRPSLKNLVVTDNVIQGDNFLQKFCLATNGVVVIDGLRRELIPGGMYLEGIERELIHGYRRRVEDRYFMNGIMNQVKVIDNAPLIELFVYYKDMPYFKRYEVPLLYAIKQPICPNCEELLILYPSDFTIYITKPFLTINHNIEYLCFDIAVVANDFVRSTYLRFDTTDRDAPIKELKELISNGLGRKALRRLLSF